MVCSEVRFLNDCCPFVGRTKEIFIKCTYTMFFLEMLKYSKHSRLLVAEFIIFTVEVKSLGYS